MGIYRVRLLAEMKIDSIATAKEAARKLHALGTPNIIVTSMNLPMKDVPQEILMADADEASLYCLTSQMTPDGKDCRQHLIAFPTYQGYFTGTGDMFASLVVARWQEEQETQTEPSLAKVCLRVVSSVNAVTRRTWKHQQKHLRIVSHGQVTQLNAQPSDPALVRCCELQLIKGKHEIENPDLVGQGVVKMAQI